MSRESGSIVVFLALVFGDVLGVHVPAAVIAAGGLHIAAVTVQRTSQEKLLQPAAILVAQVSPASSGTCSLLPQPSQLRSEPELAEQRSKVIVCATRHHPFTVAQRTSHSQLGGDRFADKGALVGQHIQQLGQAPLRP